MKKQIIITTILLAVTASVTWYYFKNLNTPGMRVNQVMRVIPGSAALIFEFNNDQSFYGIFAGNRLLTAVAGQEKIDDLVALRQSLLLNPVLAPFFNGQNIFISIHPSATEHTSMLITLPAGKNFELSKMEQLSKQPANGMVITPFRSGNVPGYTVYLSSLKKRFYIISKAENVFSCSFSKELIDECAAYKSDKDKPNFTLLSEQQHANSLANLYVNYNQLSPVFDQLFQNKNTDIFKRFRLLPGLATLSLNYKTDALMFSGITSLQLHTAASYLNLFTNQQPVENHLKDIFPSTTAYSTSFSVSDPAKFENNLSAWYAKAGIKNEEDQLFSKIRAETGVKLHADFDKLLGNEFAIVTTRYFEKFAFVSLQDGSKLKLMIANISTMTDENAGQLNYEKLPFFLLGDAFSIFKRPYFVIIDNYLVFANSRNELASFGDIYLNRKFLSKNNQYEQFDNLLAARSNVAFLFNFKNAEPILKRDTKPEIYNSIEKNEPGWSDFYSASWQLTSVDKNFYTNFCMILNTDTTATKK